MEKYQLEQFLNLLVTHNTDRSKKLEVDKSDEIINEMADIGRIIQLLNKFKHTYYEPKAVKTKGNKKPRPIYK